MINGKEVKQRIHEWINRQQKNDTFCVHQRRGIIIIENISKIDRESDEEIDCETLSKVTI